MKFTIFFFYIPLVYSEIHRFFTTYTGINGQTTAGTPEFSAVTTLDDQQIDYYDSIIKKLIPRQNWMEEFTSKDMWKEDTEIRQHVQQIYRDNIPVIMQRFNQSGGVHTYQRMYGCQWDDETGDSHGFDQYGYDGEDFISLDLKENRYISPVPQALTTAMKWNNDKTKLEFLKQYYDHECVYWLRTFLQLSEATFKKADPPKVSLLQKNQDYYTCHVTGFLFRNTSILWRKNGQALSDSSKLVESGDTLPNEDGTFQRRLTLNVLPDEWREDEYSCVVEHKSLTETIQKSMTVKKTNNISSYIKHPATLAIIIILVIVVIVGLLCVLWKKLKDHSEKNTNYGKSKPSQEPALGSLLSPYFSKKIKKIRPITW